MIFASLATPIFTNSWGNENLKNTLVVKKTLLKEIPDTAKIGDADYPARGMDTVRHKKKIAEIKANKFDLALIGNSIIQTLGEFGGKYEPLKAVWKRHFVPRKAINLGYSGYRTENILWNLLNGELDFKQPPKVAILLIGTNNTDERYFPVAHTPVQVYKGTKAIVDLMRKRLPKTKILILRIFPRGGDLEKGIGKGVFHSSKKCIETCVRAGELTKGLADNKSIFWVDVNKVFLAPNGKINPKLMPDLLHPNAAGAKAWVEAIEPILAKLMSDKPIYETKGKPKPKKNKLNKAS